MMQLRSQFQLSAIIAALLLAPGCSKEATGQTVAVVNGEEVSLGELNTELALNNIPESADKKQVMPQLLQNLVDRRVLAQRAAEAGVETSPEFLSRQRRMNEELLIGLYTKRVNDNIKAPTQQEIDRYMAANPGKFQQRAVLNLDQIQFRPPADMSLLRQMEDDKNLDEVARTLTSLGLPFQRGSGRLDTATVPEAMLKQIMALPPGEPFVVPAGGQMVASVITGRQQATLPLEESRKLAVEFIKREKLNEALQNELKQLRQSAKIEYQDGYAPKAGAGKQASAPTKS